MTDDQFTLTQRGYDDLQRELGRLEVRLQRYVDDLADIGSDVGHYEARDVGAFEALADQKGLLEDRINRIRTVLSNAAIVLPEDMVQVGIGQRVTAWDVNEGGYVYFNVLSAPEAMADRDNQPGSLTVSAQSPVGQALLGKRVGDVIDVEVPDGMAQYCIYGIEALSGSIPPTIDGIIGL